MQRLVGEVQHYDWGSDQAIPEILGEQPNGQPWAEYWLGAHPKAPSVLADGVTLDQWLADHPEELGRASRDAFGDRLPFLLKILSASHALSIQAHPSREQAERGFAAENEAGVGPGDPNRIFRDDWPKPEMIVALTDFDALCGFRDPSSSLVLLSGLGKLDGLDEVLAPLGQDDGLAKVVATVLSGDEKVVTVVEGVVAASRTYLEEGTDEAVRGLARTAVELSEDHPGDTSILVALLMNRVRLAPGQQIHLGAGTMHAYLGGTGVEIMANSDNVLRGGLTSKYVDVDALLDHAIMTPEPCVGEYAVQVSPGVGLYRTEFPEFRLWALQGHDDTLLLPATDLGRILLVTEGQLVAHCDDEDCELNRGQSAWLSAGEEVTVTGQGRGFLAGAGVDADHS
ncbi:mannose-6-phosphate isomerase, class I [Cutibacterium avidum]|uniref:mannose-6-phosphate isomerase, class I n=1 Tax=Cutibacterium avidum TaxID=33010 RepID=UPI0008F593BF|nr:mannose-6-phosphate isomerase, class I [Cutibacterium avidum]MCO6660386.1 mannose-6-phosphate isomerase, class I [Cutibacterium avidum]MDK7697977.1 mannose-6-phosphate isomerase, class I [Cutibacterium avidum]OIJ79722.1 mannose-6-phosphate isomerase [Cutibacterium avidum]